MASAKLEPRERLLSAAYDLFSRSGIRAVGIDTILDQAGVAKATLYAHFASKDELVVAALQRREQLWTRGWLEYELEQRGGTPQDRLLAIFDAFDSWFRRRDFEGCMFLSTLLESHDRNSLIGAEAGKQLARIRSFVAGIAEDAGVTDPKAFAAEWQILMMGAILAANEGDLGAAKRAREVGNLLLQREGVRSGA